MTGNTENTQPSHLPQGGLAAYDILDTAAEPGYDDIVTLASHICATPIAYVSFIDGNRQWFKAKIGFEMSENTLDNSFCQHAVQERAPLLVIPDLANDSRTAESNLVQHAPHLRFYAGAVLMDADDQVLGTVCVMDVNPHPNGLSAAQQSAMLALARQVKELLQLRQSIRQRDAARARMQASEQRYLAVFESALDYAIMVLDRDGRVEEWNEGATRLFGWTLAEMKGLVPDVLLSPQDRASEVNGQEMARALESGNFSTQGWYLRKDDSQLWMKSEIMPLRQSNGNITGFVRIMRDRTEQHILEAQREVMTQELGHRMKNTLTIVGSIAAQTFADRAEPTALEGFGLRLAALSAAHDLLIQSDWTSSNLRSVVTQTLSPHANETQLSMEGPDLELSPHATVSVTLLLHELATNAIKYGALSKAGGTVHVAWVIGGNEPDTVINLSWKEMGGPAVSSPVRKGFGSKLIRSGLVGSRVAELHYKPEGFEATFTAPLSSLRVTLT